LDSQDHGDWLDGVPGRWNFHVDAMERRRAVIIVSATVFLHPSLLRRMPMSDIVRRLGRAGYALSNVRAKHHSYEARWMPNVTRMRRVPAH
jgi:hypothetical protein